MREDRVALVPPHPSEAEREGGHALSDGKVHVEEARLEQAQEEGAAGPSAPLERHGRRRGAGWTRAEGDRVGCRWSSAVLELDRLSVRG